MGKEIHSKSNEIREWIKEGNQLGQGPFGDFLLGISFNYEAISSIQDSTKSICKNILNVGTKRWRTSYDPTIQRNGNLEVIGEWEIIRIYGGNEIAYLWMLKNQEFINSLVKNDFEVSQKFGGELDKVFSNERKNERSYKIKKALKKNPIFYWAFIHKSYKDCISKHNSYAEKVSALEILEDSPCRSVLLNRLEEINQVPILEVSINSKDINNLPFLEFKTFGKYYNPPSQFHEKEINKKELLSSIFSLEEIVNELKYPRHSSGKLIFE